MTERIKDGPRRRFEVRFSTSNGLPTVTLHFGAPALTSVTMSPEQTRQLARALAYKADEAELAVRE